MLKLTERHQHEIVTAAPIWHELFYGCQRLPVSPKREILETFLQTVLKPNRTIIPYDARTAEWHAKEQARLTSMGKMPSFVDEQVAAIAMVNGLVLSRTRLPILKIFTD